MTSPGNASDATLRSSAPCSAKPATQGEEESLRSTSLRVLHLIPYLGRAMGGPVLALGTLADGLAAAGCRVTVGSVERPGDGERVALRAPVEQVVLSRSMGGVFRWCPSLRSALARRPFDVVHSHGLWTYAAFLADRLAASPPRPHVLAPCGMLQEKALRRSAWKKIICRRLFQDRVLARAACLHAKSEAEYEGIRRFGLPGPVAVIPNPIAAPELGAAGPGPFLERHPLPEGKRMLLYLGRLHPVKGLARLIEAWSALGERRSGWRLVLAGPDEGGYQAALAAKVDSAGCRGSISFVGPLDDRAKWSAYGAADLFVMPSDFENFGLAIAEAMLAGKAVVTTTGTPWSVLRESRCGWWVEPEPRALAGALAEAMALPPEALRARGAACRRLVEPMSAPRVVESCLALYRWLLRRADRPECVRTG